MANEIYDNTWFGNTIDTASSIGTSTEMIQGQINMNKLGDDLVVNGDFATDSDWVLGGSGSNTATIGLNSATITSVDGNSYIQQNSVLTSGKNYKISYEILSSSADTNVLKLASSFGISEIPTSIGTHIIYGNAISSNLYIERYTNGVSASITNISVKQVRATTVEAKKCLADTIHRIGLQDIQN